MEKEMAERRAWMERRNKIYEKERRKRERKLDYFNSLQFYPSNVEQNIDRCITF